MRISRYEILHTVVNCGSFSRAAEALGYTQSAISQSVAALEDELGVSLLERSRHGVTLSADGALLYPDILAICDAESGLSDRISAIQNVLIGTVRIGSFTSISCHLLSKVIALFNPKYPGITFEVMHGYYQQIRDWILSGTVQLGFVLLPAPPELEVIPLSPEPLMAILPLDHPLARLKRIPIRTLCQEKFVLLEEGYMEEIAPVFTAAGIAPQVAYRTTDHYTILSFVEQGLGVSILPQRVLARNPYQLAIRPLDPPFFRQLGIAVKKQTRLSTATQVFWDEFKRDYATL